MIGIAATIATMNINIAPTLVDRLRSAERVVVLTGSGVSAESGVPTFRDAQTGLWSRFSPEELATPGAFERDPALIWDWYQWRRELVSEAQPNPGHRALARLENRPGDFMLITQNVDGLHQRAGSANVIEFHGNIMRTKCSAEGTLVDTWPTDHKPPRCQTCNAYLRPDVVWFGEVIPEQALARAFASAENCEVFLSIGTSSLVYPAAGLAEIALRAGAAVIEINPNPTPLSAVADFSLRGPAGEVLPELVQQVTRL